MPFIEDTHQINIQELLTNGQDDRDLVHRHDTPSRTHGCAKYNITLSGRHVHRHFGGQVLKPKKRAPIAKIINEIKNNNNT